MKRSEFPEKAYETMFVHELLNYFTKSGTTPFYIPSQVVEKKLGYDLCFADSSGNPLKRKVILFQFKISEQYAKAKPHKQYKFEIYECNAIGNRFRQHNKLCRYNTHGSKIAGVYSAPRFVLYKDFYKKVQASSIIADSELFLPSVRLYSGHHYVEFDNSDAKQCSREETDIEMLSFEELLQRVESVSKEQFDEILKEVTMSDDDMVLDEEIDESIEFNGHKIKDEDAFRYGGQYYLFI